MSYNYLEKPKVKVVDVFMKFEDDTMKFIGKKKVRLYHRFKDKAIIMGDGRQVELVEGKWVYLVK